MKFPVYEPREDSFLIADNCKGVHGNVLEIGFGSGYVCNEISKLEKVKKIIGVDINPECIKYANENYSNKKISFIHSDLFSNINEKFDYIICNPPYLPNEGFEDPSLFGGKHGYEFIEKILMQIKDYLVDNGKLILLFSNLSKKNIVDELIEKNFLTKELLEEKYIGSFETLYIYSIKMRDEFVNLKKKGVEQIEFFNKGKRGFIFTGIYKNVKVGIKVHNEKSESDSIFIEGNMLKIVNSKQIGPKLILSNKKFVVYKFFEGEKIEEYMINTTNRNKIIKTLINTYAQLRELDLLRIDKKEMSHPHKHILISKENNVCLIDFERARRDESPSNLTGFSQFITSTNFSKLLKEKDIIIDKKEMIRLNQEYKKDYSKENYDNIIRLLNN